MSRTTRKSSRLWKILGNLTGLELCSPVSDLQSPAGEYTSDLSHVATRARAWARFLPTNHDLYLGASRPGMMAANVLACRLGGALAPAELFVDGGFWMSGQVADYKPKSALLVALRDSSEVEPVLTALREARPDLRIDVGILFPKSGKHPVCVSNDKIPLAS